MLVPSAKNIEPIPLVPLTIVIPPLPAVSDTTRLFAEELQLFGLAVPIPTRLFVPSTYKVFVSNVAFPVNTGFAAVYVSTTNEPPSFIYSLF